MTETLSPAQRIERQLAFILEVDRLKSVLRRSTLINGDRRENSAEHSWHVALMTLILAEHADEPVDPLRAVKMLLVHDIVEIDAGDTYAYDATGQATQHAREEVAAQRIFGLLPDDQAVELIELWREFDAQASAESRFANAIDRLMPLLHNFYNQGQTWQEHSVDREQVRRRMQPIAAGSDRLWTVAQKVIDEAVTRRYLAGD